MCTAADTASLVFIGNLVGCLAMVAAVQAAGIFAGSSSAAINLAVYKTSHTFAEVRTAIECRSVCLVPCKTIMANGL